MGGEQVMTFREIIKALCSGNCVAFDIEDIFRKIHMRGDDN